MESLRRSSAKQIADLKTELVNVKKDKDKLTTQIEKDKSAKESEIISLKSKITSLEKNGLDTTKIKEMKANYSDKISSKFFSGRKLKLYLIFLFSLNVEGNITIWSFTELTNQIEKMGADYDKLNEEYKALVVLKGKVEEENQSVNR